LAAKTAILEHEPYCMVSPSLSVRWFAPANGKPSAETGGIGAGVSFHVLVHKTMNDAVDRIETMSDNVEVLRAA
jgi:hypothetical protein